MLWDLVAVYDEARTKLISYKYDAGGNQTLTEHNSGYSTTAYSNPFRYMGYYYVINTDLHLNCWT